MAETATASVGDYINSPTPLDATAPAPVKAAALLLVAAVGGKLIGVHIHGPGLIHSKDPVTKLEDLKGMKVRGGSRVINIMLEQLGATPVGMPVPAVGEALLFAQGYRLADITGAP